MALITFDLDGVLQRNPFARGVFPHIYRLLTPGFRARHPEIAPDQADAALARLVRQEFRRRQEAGDWVRAYDWDSIVATVAAQVGYDGDPIAIAPLVERFCAPGFIHAYPGAHQCLTALRADGHTLVVVTNGYAAYQEPVLAALGLRQYFDAVFTPDRCGTAKPFPGIFACAGAPPALHVGDTLTHDMYGACQAGFVGCWLPPDLPEGLRPLTPRQRAGHPDLPGYMASRLSVESQWHPAPAPAPADCVPGLVVQNLSEVPLAARSWLEGD